MVFLHIPHHYVHGTHHILVDQEMLGCENEKVLEFGDKGGFHVSVRGHDDVTTKAHAVNFLVCSENKRRFLPLTLSRRVFRRWCFLGAVGHDWYFDAFQLHALLHLPKGLYRPTHELGANQNGQERQPTTKKHMQYRTFTDAKALSYRMLQGERTPVGVSQVG